jgi:aspartyl protease family protein
MAAVVHQLQRLIAGAALLVPAALAQAQGVSLAGRMGDKALVVVGGQTHVLAPGQSAGGVRMLRWADDAAVLERSGSQFSLRVGGAPVAMAGAAAGGGGREIVIPVGPGGHFMVDGSINGRATRFMVDTGATRVAMSLAEAQRLGIDLSGAQSTLSSTAGGTVPTLTLTLTRVRVGEVELSNVQAAVVRAPMPYVLLGNSFLHRFSMRREADVMRLELR